MNYLSNLYKTLYDPEFEHDACGAGFVANIYGKKDHEILRNGIQAVVNLTHRGAIGGDAKTGDGAGILTQIPHKLFQRVLENKGMRLSSLNDLAVGMIFLPRDDSQAQGFCRDILEQAVKSCGLITLGWREVPVNPSVLGDKALSTQPVIQQMLIARPHALSDVDYERSLYLARKQAERRAESKGIQGFYIPSFSHRTIVYKGLFVAPQLEGFYSDLQHPDFETALAVFHQRYSTNTFPNWYLAQPFRMLAHNGEINTLQGNRNWIKAREPELKSKVWGEKVKELIPIVQAGGSDSASLDNVLEAVVMSGRDIMHAFMMLIPEAWENLPNMPADWRAFYQYHAALSEPWDGPAALAFTDGVIVGATLDRNGLRPARYKVTDDGIVTMASEVGVLDIPDEKVVQKGRLGPGQMIIVDTQEHLLLTDDQVKQKVANRKPYEKLVKSHFYSLPGGSYSSDGFSRIQGLSLVQLERAMGYTSEELQMVIKPMMIEAKDPVWSMGDDIPAAVLSSKPRSLFYYFKQRFAQVTNPPIDPLREQLVMSLNTYLGSRSSLLEAVDENVRLLHLTSPCLTDADLTEVRSQKDPAFHCTTLSAVFDVRDGTKGLEKALHRLCQDATKAVDAGNTLLIISDKGVDKEHAPIPMALAIGAIHHHLIREGKRMKASLIAETGEVTDIHHFAVLIGFGASAVNPYLAFKAIHELVEEGAIEGLELTAALKNYKKSVDGGLLKIISKMGISTITGYHGAQIFEVLGLGSEVVDMCFEGTVSRIGGIGFQEIAQEALERHASAAFPNSAPVKLDDLGLYRFRKEGEYHAFNPLVVRALHKAVRENSYEEYQKYAKMVEGREPTTLRDLLAFKPAKPIPIDEVEPVESIRQRFNTTAMSLGALSPEAHKTLAIGMNRIGARSNTGEGGEDPDWHRPFSNGDSANSGIKQIASARFGVTPEYISHAEELEIKMAQGSKPGEGGQLPGHKVAPHIARIRHAVPGVPLISPAPHHDIYSIEDIAQLIYDLKVANPRAKVCVKLVSEVGVGTIAAGVAKGYADVILVSGHDGGTGASPLSSIKNAGTPWELGLAETQQVLVMNDLRGRVTLKTDGGLKTGRDVVIAATLGAEEFGFGTAAVVAIGCDMARQCHLNTCPTGIATQREDLRAKFTGTPEMIINFFNYMAEEVREILASLGFKKLDDIIGRTDLLQQIQIEGHRKVNTLDLSPILAQVDPSGMRPRRRMMARNDRGDTPLDNIIIVDVREAIAGKGSVSRSYGINNTNRTVGARLSGEIAKRYGDKGLPGNTIELNFSGSAGQSFGAFLIKGVRLVLTGEANDYVGKGMGGGEIVVKPPPSAKFRSHENVIAGNTVLYGATAGALFVAGRAGERFAVRNSGATAVVEGAGDHCCEYMTGGVVVVLGDVGRNFGAGMSNGSAYVLDESRDFHLKYNPELVSIERVSSRDDETQVKELIYKHWEATRSLRAKEVLDHWTDYLPLFWKIIPNPAKEIAKAKAEEGKAAQLRDTRAAARA